MTAHFRACIRVVSISLLSLVIGWSQNLGTAGAAIIITAPDISLPYSATDRTENVEVYVQDTDATPPTIGDEQVELKLPVNPDVFSRQQARRRFIPIFSALRRRH